MRIVCPNCSAAYDVPPERVPPGRNVKCARCANNWTPVPTPEQSAVSTAEPEIPPAPLPTMPAPADPSGPNLIERLATAMPGPAIAGTAPQPFSSEPEPSFDSARPGAAPPLPRPPARVDWRLGAAWLLTALILIGAGWAAIARRADIMRAWPPSERAYTLIGLADSTPRQ